MLTFDAAQNLSLLEGSIPNVTRRLAILAGWELAQSQTLLNWAATGSEGEVIVSAGGNLVLGEAELVQSILKADARISISSNSYIDGEGVQRGGNLAVVTVPTGWSIPKTRQLNLYAKNYLHLHESFSALDLLQMRGGQTMITRRAILRNLAGDILADGPDAAPILAQLSQSVATISGTKLELQQGTLLRLEQQIGSGDQFASDTEIVLVAGDIIVQVESAQEKQGEAPSNRNVVAPNTTMAGALTGAGSLIKRGDGVLQLDAHNTYTGLTVVEAGRLVINGSTIPESRVEVRGGILSGSGEIGGEVIVSSGAVLSPGSSPGILSSGPLTLSSGSTYVVEIEGHSPGTGYDQTVVTGAVDLGGATLDVRFTGFVSNDGHEFIIIDNDGTDAVTGRFAGLPDGAKYRLSSPVAAKIGRISYYAGDGNDVSIIIDEVAPRFDIPSSGDAELEFRMIEETFQILINGAVKDTFVLDGIDRLTIGGRVGYNDVLRLNFGNANARLLQKLTSLTIDLGGDAGDKLIINANNGDVTLAHTTTGNGTITVNALTLPFTGVGTDTVSIENSDDLTITLPATADNFVFTAHSSTGYSQLVGTALTKTLFTNPASSLTINLANDTNTLTITSLDADFNPTGGVTINGGNQSDTFSFTSLGSAFTRSLNVLGNSGTDSATFTASLTTSLLNVQTENTTLQGTAITTTGGNMTYSGNVTLSNGPFTFNTGGGNLSIAGNFAAGGRNVILASGIGAGMTTIGGNVTALGSGTGAALTVQSGVTGLVYLQGTVAGTSGITAAAGSSLRFDDNVTLAAGNTGTTLQGLVRLDGLTWSSHNGISMGTVTLSSGSVSLNSNNSALTFTGPVNGSENLTLTAGTADISFSAGAGQSSRLDRLQVVSAKDVTFGGNVAAESFLQSAGTGTTTFSGTLNTNTAAGVNITGTNFRAVGTVTATANGGLTVLLSGSAPNGRATIEGGAHISSDGPVSITAPGGLTTGGNIVTTNDDITITAAVVLSHDVTIDSGPGAGNISFTSTIDGTTANSQALQLDGGSAGTVAVAGRHWQDRCPANAYTG
jgi:autotransporter-associated beta strand protein